MWNIALFFSNKNHSSQKKTHRKIVFFCVDYVKIIELHVVHTSHAI